MIGYRLLVSLAAAALSALPHTAATATTRMTTRKHAAGYTAQPL
jgi:hypothetical protein